MVGIASGNGGGRTGGVLNRIEFPVLLAGVLVAGGLWGFVEMLELARSAGPHTFDTQILLALREAGQPDRPIGPRWLPGVMRDVTALGSASVLTMATAFAAFYFLLTRRAAIGLFVIACVAGGQIMATLLKLGIDRQRPDVVTHLVQESSLSFPSGHATHVGDHLSDAGGIGGVLPAYPRGKGLCAVAGRVHDAAGRCQPALSRRPLAVGRASPAGASVSPGRCCAGWPCGCCGGAARARQTPRASFLRVASYPHPLPSPQGGGGSVGGAASTCFNWSQR